MDASLESLVGRLDHLSGEFRELRDGVQKAIQIADADPEMALTRARKVLEYVVRDVYQRRINEPPGTRPLENLLQRLVKDRFFPDRLDAYANTIRKLGNVGTHTFDEKIEVSDVYQSLTQLMPILEWYFEVERPEALDGQVTQPKQPVQIESRPKEAPPATVHSLLVVPKGLRSFDARDADFFLDLLPGPRGKDGLPESISFWKHRIENQDEATFTVGLIYGPSGCGKSSLVKAGLLPRLASNVLSVYIEATGEDTEARLLKGLCKRCPGLPTDLGLKEAFTELRCGRGMPKGKKVLIVIDQFEQWLHAKKQEENTELIQALRQCDGEQVQCIVMVRDDFWMATTRFMRELELRLLEGQNSLAVDLFDLDHAKKVLSAFGRAFGKLPENADETSKEQKEFLKQAMSGLAHEGKVICVRLALFAEMIKGKAWTPASLNEMGGMEGVGVTFLEETFSAATAPPEHRLHQKAVLSVLKALLPEAWTNIKGHMRSYQELLEASGYADRPSEFEELIRILDRDLRLITPTDLEGINAERETPLEVSSRQRFYQLTHDYLVPSIREWLIRKQRESRQGRAELRLAVWSSVWNNKQENRNLPSLWEYLSIRLMTDRKHWTEPQKKMMRKAGRVQGIRSGIVAAVLVVASVAGLSVRNAVIEKQNVTHAEGLVDGLVNADITQVPLIVVNLEEYRAWADPLLKTKYEHASEGSSQRLNMALALLPVDESKVNFLRDQLLTVTPQQFPVVRDALLPHKASVVKPLWDVALDSKREVQPRFQAACALATYAPGDERWDQISTLVAGHLVSQQASDFLAWRKALEPAKGELIGPLTSIYNDKHQREQNRTYATEALADYAGDRPDDLFNLLATAEDVQFPVMFGKLTAHREKAVALAQAELTKGLPEKEDEKENLAQRQANAAVALLKLGTPEKVWPLLKSSPDPRVRSYIIHWLSPLGADPQAIIKRLEAEFDVTIRRALVLALGEFTETQLPVAQRQPLIEKLLVVFENEPDSGLHGAVEWLLRKWGQGDRLEAVLKKLQGNEEQLHARKATDKRQWYVNTQGQTFVILNADTFEMGSPKSEPDHKSDETRHRCHIGRRLAISTTEVTKAQYRTFQRKVESFNLADHADLAAIVQTDDSPQTAMTWYEAAWYCNWLSEQEGIPKAQWCYEPVKAEDDKPPEYGSGMKPKDKYLELNGYRLPTEAEWEYACRAGTLTSRYYGLTETLLPNYAWYQANGKSRTWTVASLKPNDFGLFDMVGNAYEWCDSLYQSHPGEAGDKASEDSGITQPVVDGVSRVLRGGAFNDQPGYVRSAYRGYDVPTSRGGSDGFRPARTYPLSPLLLYHLPAAGGSKFEPAKLP